MHPQVMWDRLQYINGLWFFMSQHTTSWWWCGTFAGVLPKAGPHLGCSVAWMDRVPVYLLCPSLLQCELCTKWTCEWVVTHAWHVVLPVTSHTTLRMAWLFCRSYRTRSHHLGVFWIGWSGSQCIDCDLGFSSHIWNRWHHIYDLWFTTSWLRLPGRWRGKVVPTNSDPIAWVLHCVDGWDPSMLIMSKTCETVYMHPQDVWNGWQSIHDLWFTTS